jgi:NTP pyrophosphatase (non-canonical NTP hydrolase)
MNLINEKRVKDLTLKEIQYSSDINLFHRILKLQEEVGELSASVLYDIGCSNKSKSAASSSIVEELCDVLNVSLDLLFYLNHQEFFTEDEFKDMFEKKLDKWENKIHPINIANI